jgi:hypothetical protein
LPATSRGLTEASSARACRADRNFLAPAGQQFQQQPVQPVDDLGAGPAQLIAAVSQHAHHHQVLLDLDPDQARGAQRDQGHRVRIDRVGLAPVAGGEHPHLRGQLGRHVKDDLTVMNQAVRQVPADAVAALHRPDPVRELARRREHLAIPDRVRAVLPARQHRGPLVDDLDRGRALMRVHPDDHAHRFLLGSPGELRARRALLLRAGQTPFEPPLARRPASSRP